MFQKFQNIYSKMLLE